MLTNKEIALAYAKNGIMIFPCDSTKKPLTKEGFKDATTHIETVEEWWDKFPNAMIGSPNTQFSIIDVDNYGLDEAEQLMCDTQIARLKESGIIKGAMTVTTLSGGTHYYLAANENFKRSIFALPYIDFLGKGGYVILPDQKNYVSDCEKPWETVLRLPELDYDALMDLRHDLAPFTKAAKTLQNSKGTKGGKKSAKKVRVLDMESVNLSSDDSLLTEAEIEAGTYGVNYTTGEFSFKQTPNMYKAAPITPSKFEVRFDKDGYLILDGKVNTDIINGIFHNTTIQSRLCRWMGLLVPTSTEMELQRSIIPTHIDERPSMGTRLNAKGTHVIVRDFSNHYGDKYDQIDYNLVRLYATCKYNTLAPRMSSPEFVVWFLRMLVEASIIKLDSMKVYNNEKLMNLDLTPSEKKVAEGIRLLDAIKELYDGYDGMTTFADRFTAAWCGIDASTGNRAKKRLVELGYLREEGMYDCSGGNRPDGFYKTKLYRIVTEQVEKEEETVEMSEVVTTFECPVDERSYEIIKNFAIDRGWENKLPIRRNMMVALVGFNGVVEWNGGTFLDEKFAMDNLSLTVVDKFGDKGKILLLVGESVELASKAQRMHHEFPREHAFTDEPLIGIVINNDFDGEITDGMLNQLDTYLSGVVTFAGVTRRVELAKNMFDFIYDGHEPDFE